jgi:septum formation inhibitor MinC
MLPTNHNKPQQTTDTNSRALAGLSGDPKARIFAGRFNAELVAIGDVFTTCDQPNDLPGVVTNAPTSVALDARTREITFHSFKV